MYNSDNDTTTMAITSPVPFPNNIFNVYMYMPWWWC